MCFVLQRLRYTEQYHRMSSANTYSCVKMVVRMNESDPQSRANYEGYIFPPVYQTQRYITITLIFYSCDRHNNSDF